MSILTPKRPDNSPGALAAKLADARVAFEDTRAYVIEQAAQRGRELAELQAEIERERKELDSVQIDATQRV